MMVKKHGRNRVHNVMAKAGYGVGGAAHVARGESGIPKALKTVERELRAPGGAAKHRMDRKPRASGGRTPKKDFNPGGHKGKLHRELGIPEGQKIPADRLQKAMHSKNREVRNDAIRANTMKHWKH